MAAITPVTPAIGGAVLALAAASGGGDTLANLKGNVFLVVNNGGVGSINVTLAAVTTARPADGPYPPQTVANNVVAVGAGVQKIIGPIPAAFNDGSGNIAVTYSGVSSVTVGAIQQ